MPHDPEPYSAEPASPVSGQVDIRAYWRVVVRRRWTIAAVLAAAVVLTLLVTLRQTKIYAATTSLVIEVSAPKLLNQKDVQDVVETGATSYLMAKEYFETQYRIITSRAVAQRVIDKYQLARDVRFLGLEDVRDEGKLKLALEKIDSVAVLQDRLKIVPVKDSRVAQIQVEDRDPKWSATLANAVADAYIAETLSVQNTTTQGASDWLEQQLADLEGKLEKSGKALFEFKKSHDIVATTWEDRQNIVTQRLVTINDALTRTRVQKAQLEARSEQLEALRGALDHGELPTEAFAIRETSRDGISAVAYEPRTISELKVRYAEAKLECAGLKDKYLEDHPGLKSCQARMISASEAIRNEVRSVIDAAKLEYREVLDTERKLTRLLEATKHDAFDLNQFEREYLEVKRAHDNNQRMYDLVLQRLKETGVTGMMRMSNVRILDRAETPERPARPKPLRNLAIAAALGLLGGFGLAFFLEFLDTTVTTREQVEEHLGLPFLGIIPSIERAEGAKERDLFVHAHPQSAVAECLRSIRTNLLFMSPEKPLRTILITSSGPGEGKTTTASTLAEVMADGGNRVLLVDADMRRPQLHKVFEFPNDAGLSSLILGEGKLQEVVRTTAVPNLFLLPCGPIPPNPTELLHTGAFTRLLAEAAQRFDRVIIDSPPVGVVADAVVMSTSVDGTLLVLKAGQTSRDLARQAIRRLADVNARVFGAVLNDLDLENQKYGQYYYYYRYGYAYGDKPSASNA